MERPEPDSTHTGIPVILGLVVFAVGVVIAIMLGRDVDDGASTGELLGALWPGVLIAGVGVLTLAVGSVVASIEDGRREAREDATALREQLATLARRNELVGK